MQIDIITALKWPYQKENWKSAILFPGAVCVVLFIVFFTLYFLCIAGMMGAAALSSASEGAGVVAMALVFLAYMGAMILLMLFSLPIYGYFWEVVHVLRTQGYDADSPTWSGRFKEYSMNGLKIACFYIALNLISFPISLTISLVSLPFGEMGEILSAVLSLILTGCSFLIMPYIYGAFIHTAESKSLKGLFNIKKAYEVGSQCYLNVMLMFLVVMVMGFCYMIVLLISCCTLIGPPFISAAWWATIVHLFVQAFDNYKDEEPLLALQEA